MSRAMSRAITRQTFLLAVPEALLAKSLAAESTRPKLLIVAAHPDDEYAVAATTYRLTRELGWAADHVVITNGEAGYRYSALAEAVYGIGLTGESEGRSRLPAIRRRETLAAGKVLGIRRHYFLDQRDSGFATDAANAPTSNWDHAAVLGFLTGLLHREHYDAIFTLLPTPETHGHHRAATLLALEAAATLPEERRPLLLAADPCAANAPTELFRGMPGQPLSRTNGEGPVFVFDRDSHFGYRNALNYQIVVNWFIAEHKSQGLFQADSGKHQLEQFWLFEASGRDAESRARELAARLTPAAHQVAAL
jgi:N-acetylglucosamine malate deacetylase 2